MLLKREETPETIILKNLATPTRFYMLKFMLEKERTVFDLQDLFLSELGIDTDVSLFHVHLTELKKCGLITSRTSHAEKGRYYYRLNECGSALIQIFSNVKHLSKGVRMEFTFTYNIYRGNHYVREISVPSRSERFAFVQVERQLEDGEIAVLVA